MSSSALYVVELCKFFYNEYEVFSYSEQRVIFNVKESLYMKLCTYYISLESKQASKQACPHLPSPHPHCLYLLFIKEDSGVRGDKAEFY